MSYASPNPNHPAALNAYRQVGIQTASPQQLVLMLFDGLDRELGRAQARAAEPEGGVAVRQSLAILAELEASLDLEQGGEMAANLFALYDFLARQLREQGAARAAEVRALVAPVADAWRTICAREPAPDGYPG